MTETNTGNQTDEHLRYPIGRYNDALQSTPQEREEWIEHLRRLPDHLEEAIEGLDEDQLNTPYRDGGWTVRQVVHHLADSHMNAYMRLKLTLTEDQPTIKPYEEGDWAKQPDAFGMSVGSSLLILRGLHMRWTFALESLTNEQWGRTFFHPESQSWTRLDTQTSHYVWHGQHHTAQITTLKKRLGWV
ncbi:YfiT family bacillithiol transferase [Saccharibacillus sp. JS10]|uniref:YfiT family bacillithiol transferase n=1 Tax=Saccharibacillus sp. JS10 TaxID=2950552 RepID=UPI00210F1A1F|nr:putative metal-dependent hydrolase [Saccharibacillus sp. JS10]MCQ4087125.1 putative metal-dependent hydrolase [Saccharibacillus sp. JS10]